MALVKKNRGLCSPFAQSRDFKSFTFMDFQALKLTTLMDKQSRKQNLRAEKEKDHASRNMLILMEQHHNAVCRIWSPTFRMLVMMHFSQFLDLSSMFSLYFLSTCQIPNCRMSHFEWSMLSVIQWIFLSFF